MSAHLKLDFDNDGTVTLTHRKSKDAPLGTSVSVIDTPSSKGEIGVKAGDDETVTHFITITTADAPKGYAA